MKVKEFMSADIETIDAEKSIRQASLKMRDKHVGVTCPPGRVMRERHIRRLVVLNRDDSVAGVVTIDDLARGSAELAGAVLEAATPIH